MNAVAERVKNTFFLRAFGFFKIPMLFWLGPSVVEASDSRCEIRIPLSWRSKNHLGGMYFGSLAAGADCAGGLIAMRMIQQSGKKVSLVFKDFHAEFLKRAEGDVHFICEQGREIKAMVDRAFASGERENLTLDIKALVPAKLAQEPVATFKLTLSIKKKG